ncbi:MAG: hypothetical protein LBE80_04710 [Deltaproteobacteria bacterium]|jgi:Rod binding domain-containing protein|nr:hypothetical protein [Deltaproteobacteria bacterium]
MSGSVYEIPGYSVPKELFEAQKAQKQLPKTNYLKNPASRVSSSSAAAPKQSLVFSVEDFKKGVNIGTQAAPEAAADSAAPAESSESPVGLSLRDASSGTIAKLIDELPEGAYGRRYRPLDNGKLADASGKVKNLSEEQKISKLKQIKESAEEYEGFLIAEMIKSMRQSPFVKTPGGETYSEIAEKPFTAALTEAGGLGLSQTIVNQVAAQEGLGEALAAHGEVMGPHWKQRLAPSQMPKAGPKLGVRGQSGQPQ